MNISRIRGYSLSVLVIGVLAAIVAILPSRSGEQPFESPSENGGAVDASGFTEKPQVCCKSIGPGTETLDYIRDLQQEDGSWDSWSIRSSKRKGTWSYGSAIECESEHGYEPDRIANTSLALLVYLGDGYDHTDGPFEESVRNCIKYLRRMQAQDGLFSKNVQHHCLATMAISECYGLSGTALLRPLAEKAIQALLKQKHTDGGYGESDVSNTVDTGYAVLAIKSAVMAGIEVDKSESADAFAFIESLREGDVVKYSKDRKFAPQYGNKIKDPMPVCEAAWLLSGLFANKLGVKDQSAKDVSKKLSKPEFLPEWKANNIDVQFYHFASLALFQMGDDNWKAWNKKLSKQLLDNQRGYSKLDKEREMYSADKLLDHGSWDPAGVNGPRYGRVYTTAMCKLCLQIWYRYKRK